MAPTGTRQTSRPWKKVHSAEQIAPLRRIWNRPAEFHILPFLNYPVDTTERKAGFPRTHHGDFPLGICAQNHHIVIRSYHRPGKLLPKMSSHIPSSQ